MASKLTREEADNIAYVFPKSEEITIHKSDLQIQLEKFKKRIQSSFSIFDLLAILSLWAPFFTADFKGILNFEAVQIQAGYVVFAIIITIGIFVARIKYYLFRIFKKDDPPVSGDSDEMAEKILEQCQSKIKF